MSFLSLFLAASFGVIGILLCSVILRVLYEALVGPQKGWAERWKLRQREKQLALIDTIIESGDITASFKQLRQVLFFDIIRHDNDLIERVSALHFSVLNKLIALSHLRNQHIPELVVLEDLFSSRTSLLRSWIEAVTTRNSLMRKRNNKMPEWAFDEYQRRLSEFSDQLNTNRKSIESQLEKVFTSLKSPASSSGQEDEIVYH